MFLYVVFILNHDLNTISVQIENDTLIIVVGGSTRLAYNFESIEFDLFENIISIQIA
jgi:hypothetical protein